MQTVGHEPLAHRAGRVEKRGAAIRVYHTIIMQVADRPLDVAIYFRYGRHEGSVGRTLLVAPRRAEPF